MQRRPNGVKGWTVCAGGSMHLIYCNDAESGGVFVGVQKTGVFATAQQRSSHTPARHYIVHSQISQHPRLHKDTVGAQPRTPANPCDLVLAPRGCMLAIA